ncbi:L-histidine N(alpha)-methyltransferase [Rubrivirga litoralis]|uniref:L-histidine N(Alpha)-methyltransferase n=1 Tax=Rubrivirga litoralis TaxID=3075598 RepID=A0ABU3BUU5_9BACT|nr:L-histidine N(alpha)-methyltransferase [Rubrivirga sp. F394]MDT0633005.1 L-histidine N(alpha)-methyltransferase [Rubrivirga sp. F394]
MPDSATPPADAGASSFLADVVRGLSSRPRTLPAKYFYDERGSELFDEITRLDAYYPTRTERDILETHADDLVDAIGKNSALVEYGSGSSDKTRILLSALHARRTLAAYVPIDISEDYLLATAERLRAAYPGLPVLPVAADYTRPFRLPALPPETARRVVFFPGSTIGNFTPDEAEEFFRHAKDVAGRGGAILLGVDQKKDPAVLEAAYDDPEGVTAAFNLNLLQRLNREFGADADPDAWAHEARWNEAEGRIEMHLRSTRDQTLHVGDRAFSFRDGETIHTENSYKYGPDGLAAVAARAGLRRESRWTDPRGWFAVELYTP